ncbi:hypothetical protein ABZS98_37095 [Streptomyces avermitilis]
MADGYRDSAQSWADLLHDAGAACAPVLAVGDGAFCFWKALAEMFPDTRPQRRWVHKTANVVNALPMSSQAGGRKAFQKICNAAGTWPVASSRGNPAAGCRPVRFHVRRARQNMKDLGPHQRRRILEAV